MHTWIRPFNQLNLEDLESVGGKNASLGEMIQNLGSLGIRVPDGFATTADAWWHFLETGPIRERLVEILAGLDRKEFSNLHQIGVAARSLLLHAPLPEDIQQELVGAYRQLCEHTAGEIQVAVRSSATAEDLPDASFAGQQESYLNIRNEQELLEACHNCYASLYTDRAIKYREDHGFDHLKVALSIGVQKMVRSDKASSGVCFTLDPETGFENVILITGSWGLGENVVQGAVNPDEFYVFKPTLEAGKNALLSRKLGSKALTMIYAGDAPQAKRRSVGVSHTIVNLETPPERQEQYVLTEPEVLELAQWCLKIEKHYGKHMDIEWAKDGLSGELFIVQARPETVHSQVKGYQYHAYTLKEKGELIVSGKNIGDRIAAGKARILHSPAEIDRVEEGDILVTEITNPDWDPILKKAAAIITDKGGRTSHAAIVARETGAVAVVGTGNATSLIEDGEEVTVSCIDGTSGQIYRGRLKWEEQVIDTSAVTLPEKTDVMLILADPDQAFKLAHLPNRGVGLMRLEFVINNSIQIHPMALVRYPELEDPEAVAFIEELTHHYPDKQAYFVDKLAEAVATIAAAFYPHDVIVRMSDFKSNEYANLVGGWEFEPHEENPMIGFRGASRYYHERYREGFRLECLAMKKVREEMGLRNVKLMIPFCRTLEEGQKVVDTMAEFGLKQGEQGLEIYVMCEIPSNVILAEEFAEIFDGFSIGSNDLTQLTLGVDRDSEILQASFDERNPAVKRMIAQAIATANAKGVKIGLCGQAPSDHPEFAKFLVEAGINSISFNPDALLKGIENIRKAEAEKKQF
ncbi:phosphoenolpyruvate synthase [bacterium (Candidatus Blackallbacteria) CG17_big_fil_post_rev_8_21_14_2_50_48_46]|uniref:Phosphoenolpyruvate synthase n=1 Tax=bacterium (Candidatus Blackallbacteria) CG17_big_fil_post_rev_8_21_14_2_50_48_46 TaxID=2014261 RepID=A0A2M7FZ32_9BACT|nr:MAG: phosphoenolpyruvate synthase [bacterium (Candidatus Blackallbacteria) CG18_big_fil_WC_8_21_14_2_50_49_26]PIW14495.1 MAG: phosphoenolpyruvate synthase [bacterium (Candidatus Blackallbacteria) CG17_big_fil_post_rev_8_21_14_2_50_48_46]PIW47181.1 MAG: phosphoenolpyruvate synthase [bacterium (Candidatus Blackallbacteria) CG13_big_fil_rev_8_21_14_2_50_49_14]